MTDNVELVTDQGAKLLSDLLSDAELTEIKAQHSRHVTTYGDVECRMYSEDQCAKEWPCMSYRMAEYIELLRTQLHNAPQIGPLTPDT